MTLAGRYRLERRIASGGMGTVHEGFDERLDRRVAIKVLKEEYADDPRSVERFSREARSAAGLNHPNIAQILDSGEDACRSFIVMELVAGVDLGQVLHAEGRLPPERAIHIAGQVCAALGTAHAAGIVHRDVKPGNVLVGPQDRVKVTDFGIAQAQGQAALTGTGLVLGTAQYLSPEQAAGQAATPASDLYSLGVVLFQMLSGTVPFTGESPVAVALGHLTQSVPPVDAVAPDVPPRLVAVVAHATAKDPQHRYANAGQMQTDLRNALAPLAGPTPTAQLPIGAPPVNSSSALAPRRSVGRRAWILAAAGLLLLAGALAIGWLALSDNPSTPDAERRSDPSAQQQRTDRTATPQDATTPTSDGPIVPADALGGDAKTLEKELKDLGYDVKKVDIESTAPKELVVATIPGPGEPLTAEQTVIVVASKGEPPEEPVHYVVPPEIIGSDAAEAEQLIKDEGLDVEKVDVDSTRPKDTIVTTYPAPGTTTDGGTVILAVSTGE